MWAQYTCLHSVICGRSSFVSTRSRLISLRLRGKSSTLDFYVPKGLKTGVSPNVGGFAVFILELLWVGMECMRHLQRDRLWTAALRQVGLARIHSRGRPF